MIRQLSAEEPVRCKMRRLDVSCDIYWLQHGTSTSAVDDTPVLGTDSYSHFEQERLLQYALLKIKIILDPQIFSEY